MGEKEYIIFCDESEQEGKFYSSFYGGLIVGASQYQKVTRRLQAVKKEQHLFGEIKWAKVTERYLAKYQEIVRAFFQEVSGGHVRVRIMFSHNARRPKKVTEEQREHRYYLLYYQFIKHAFGLQFIPPGGTCLRLYFDRFPDTGEKVERFKGYLHGLQENRLFRAAGIAIGREDIAEVHSHDHALLQCLDIILGAMVFRLNDKHKEKIPGQRVRGKRTRAKEQLYQTILGEIRALHPNFNIGITTSGGKNGLLRWEKPYMHWEFRAADAGYEPGLTKRKQGRKKKDPT